MTYGCTSNDNLPGIHDAGRDRPRRKNFFKITDEPHKDLLSLSHDTRMPIDYITHQIAGAFPSPR